MSEVGMADYCVDIHTITTSLLSNTFESLTANANRIESRLKQIGDDYAHTLAYQYDFVLDNKHDQR